MAWCSVWLVSRRLGVGVNGTGCLFGLGSQHGVAGVRQGRILCFATKYVDLLSIFLALKL